MLLQDWSTKDLSDHEQFDALRELVLNSPLPMELHREGVASKAPISANMEIHLFGAAAAVVVKAGAATGVRGKREIARTDQNFLCLIEPLTAGKFILNGAPISSGPNTILVLDSDSSLTGEDSDNVEYRLWTMPRTMTTPLLGSPGDRLGSVLDTRSGVGGLIKAYLSHLGPALDAVGPVGGEALLGQLAGLIAIEQGIKKGAVEFGRKALAAAKLVQAKQFVDDRLSDPRLSPTIAAHRLGISLRKLHLLFEPTGVTFSGYLQIRRLERCRVLLQSRAQAGRSVSEIAFDCGFESLATFYRAFKRHFECSPSDFR